MLTTTSISQRLVELLRNREFVRAYTELFSSDAESIDPLSPRPGSLIGLPLLIQAEEQFLSKIRIRDLEISEAICAGSYFSLRLYMQFDLGDVERIIDEICVYQVNHGLIVKQQFFVSK
jgi:hypothetical protein